MTRILVLSDTHGQIGSSMELIGNLGPLDLVIHLGDLVSDANDLQLCFPDQPFFCVPGNNDYFSKLPNDRVTEAGGMKFFCTHGHRFGFDYGRLAARAKEEGCSFALTGHTHRSYFEKMRGVWVMNPGSISLPRDSACSYGVIEIENGTAKGCICTLQERI